MNGYILAALIGLAVSGIAYVQGRADGGKLERAEYTAQRLQEATEYGIAVNGIQTRYRAQERRWAQSFASISKDYQRDLIDNGKALDIAIAGSRLFDRTAKGCGDTVPAVAPGPGRRDGEAGSHLSAEASVFLRRLASEADAVAIQLGACQAILEKERQSRLLRG